MQDLSDHEARDRARSFVAVRVASALQLALAIAAALALALSARHYFELNYRNPVDDALISMQYARNLAEGHGLVFNVGERVEGYTNFLWVVILAALYRLSGAVGGDFTALATGVNIAFAAVTLLLVYAIGKRVWGSNLSATALALGFCVLDNSYVVWAAFGLEGHLLACAMLLALWFAESGVARRGVWTGLALAAAHLTRPDAGLFNAFLLAGLASSWLGARRSGRSVEARERLHVAAQAGATWLVIYAGYFLWRYQYYGWLLPNTYYVKLGGGDFDGWARGFRYIAGFLKERAWLPLAVPLALFATSSSVMRSVILYLLAHTLYVASVGGDYFAGYRFFVPQLPLFAVSLGLVAHAVIGWATARASRGHETMFPARVGVESLTALAIAPLLFSVHQRGLDTGPLKTEILAQRGLVRINRNFMRWLSEHKPLGATLATYVIGAAGFDGRFVRVVDMSGIINPVVAHRPVAHFGSGMAGHEKQATLGEILAEKPTYIDPLGLFREYWSHGYYFDASMRIELMRTVEGMWRRDELLERGQYLSQGAWHFDARETAGWQREGDAFTPFPAFVRPSGQGRGSGELGGYVNSFPEAQGDGASGRLLSPAFELVGDKMVLRLAGGNDSERLRVSLRVGERAVCSATGLDSEYLSRREWDISAYRGRSARLEIVDWTPGGHILVDEVLQWSAKSP